jgi:hypothetical protein
MEETTMANRENTKNADQLAVRLFNVFDNSDAVTDRAIEMSDSSTFSEFVDKSLGRILAAGDQETREIELVLCLAKLDTALRIGAA